jgi:chemosensory pili system protein ChpA (sensor histidine kinase/response regulator)
MESLADAITSVEFYLESLAHDRGEYTQIIDVGRASVAKLGYPVDRESTATVERIVATEVDEAPSSESTDLRARPEPDQLTEAAEPEIAEADAVEIEIEAEPEPAPAPAPVVEEKSRPVPLAGEIDEEILEIFLEEANEEVERIGEYLPRWQKNLDDEESLVTVRRSFHTLKGSGRLVGAQLIGEFAWAFENLLNRVIDRTIEPAPHLHEVLDQSVEVLPQLIAQVRGEAEPTVDVFALMDLAEAMAKPGFVPEGSEPAEQSESRVDLEAAAELEQESGADQSTETAARPEQVETGSAEDTELSELIAEGAESVEQTELLDMPVVEPYPDTTVEVSLPPDLDFIELSSEQQHVDFEFEPEPLEEEPTAEAGSEVVGDDEPRIDAVLFGIFRNEAEQHLQVIDEYLGQDQPDLTGLAVTPELLRALHTLNGSARTAEVPEISEPYSALEHYARVRQGEDLVMPLPALALLEQAVAHARDVLERLSNNQADVPSGEHLRDEVDALLHSGLVVPPPASLPSAARPAAEPVQSVPEVEQPVVAEPPKAETASPPSISQFEAEPDLPGEQDMELVEIFLEEAVEIMDASDGTLRRWQEAQEDSEIVSEFQRQLHTLKGGARMAGFKNIGNLSHAVESLTIAVVEGEVTPSDPLFAKLNEAMDRLSAMLERAREQEPVEAAPELLANLEAIRTGHALSVPAEPVAEAQGTTGPVAEPEPDSSTPPVVETEPESQAPAEATSESAPAEGEAAGEVVDLKREREARAPKPEPRPSMRAAPQELVRVRSDLLDSLVNHAGEVNIYHSRLEQQISGFRFNLSELAQTIHRLREQLRKLEIETEAQIRFSYEKEREHEELSADFDPLELDRYSTIQQLSRALAESWNDLVSIQEFLSEQVRDAETLLLQQSRVSTDLQEGLMRTRMVQFTGAVPRLRRVVRQTASELGKRVDFDLVGETNELDRSVMERMVSPLEHMLRNAIAHGIESPEERKARGKPETGRVVMELGREGSEVVIRVSDDGAGVDLNAVRAKAKKIGLLSDTDKLSDNEVMQFILESGFSTATEVSQIAGRGVGMDVVNNEIKQLNGVLRIDSTHGKGTTFTIRLPFTLAINQALLVRTADDIFAIPLTSIEGIVRSTVGELRAKYATELPQIEYAANTYELQHLGALLGVSQPNLEDEGILYPVLLVRSGDQRIALQVESLLGSREVVIKSVGPQITQARGISGATILGDGRVVLILDIPGLVRMGAGLKSTVLVEPEEAEGEEGKPLTVMVVDDSITIRKVTARMLERNNFSVLTAKDGVDAVAQLQDQVPDLMLLDIEMPRMDGYELAQHVRNDDRLKGVPIIMITSRTGEKHRQRALDIGVDRYLGKPYQESDLLENINELLESLGQL